MQLCRNHVDYQDFKYLMAQNGIKSLDLSKSNSDNRNVANNNFNYLLGAVLKYIYIDYAIIG